MHTVLFLLLSAWVFSTGYGKRIPLTVHESIAAIPTGFVHSSSVPSRQPITLRIALTHTDIAHLQAQTYAVSDPESPHYGQHLSLPEITEYVKPTDETLSAVSEWVEGNGIPWKTVSPAGDLIQITLTVGQADALLSTKFSEFTHADSGERVIRTLAYSVPTSLRRHIQFIHPTISFVPPFSSSSLTAISSTLHSDVISSFCALVVTPTCLQGMYGIPSIKSHNNSLNTIGVAGYIDQWANKADVQLFLEKFRPDLASNTSFAVSSIDGGYNNQDWQAAGSEANLDVQYTLGLASNVPVTFLSVGANRTDSVFGFVDLAHKILAQPLSSRPRTLSTSYGFDESALTLFQSVYLCNTYMTLGAAGVSVLFSSGDGGVGGNQKGQTCDKFVPTGPSGCPFVTSVGGSTGLPPQTASSLSSGGFSNYFATPAYQAADVARYINSLDGQYDGLYNPGGRGFPDVAAQAENVAIIWMGEVWKVGGTSASTPIFASMIALVNDRLLTAGKPVLGFLNPFLYSKKGRAAFTDVTSGINPGCNTTGFSASPGWDPVTGLGTPNFTSLLSAAGL
ncbi:family S53 protease [Roridomyces roridus]|uniref:tripeptidyl-peptidase II n=1 Tax=Roridomyces roridus TaxID=1738132 RepID=A0AAD7C3J2_9AGAR|nr:family S53 protease [Roridomyces roridus]